MKKVLKIFGVLIVLLIVGVVCVFFFLGSWLRRARLYQLVLLLAQVGFKRNQSQ